MRRPPDRWAAILLAMLLVVLLAPRARARDLDVLQQPTFWIVGQWTRILIQTPADCGPLEVESPAQLELLERWPHKSGDTTQRFYFRAVAPLRAGALVFRGGTRALRLPLRVLSWQEALTEKFERRIDADQATWQGMLTLPRVFPVAGADGDKSGPSYLGREEIESQRAAAAGLQAEATAAIPRAEDLRKLFHAMPESTIPRAVYLQNSLYRPQDNPPAKGCPICGEKVFAGRSAFYPWKLDADKHPFKLQCPVCDRWFPSNDFANGDHTSGDDPDDGWGWFDAGGRPSSFVGYAVLQNHRGWHHHPDRLSQLYLASGDKRLARATAVLLVRVAEQYLNLAFNINQRGRYAQEALWAGRVIPQGTQPPSHSTWFGSGFYLDSIWSIGPDEAYAESFERLWDYWNEEDPELLRFLQAQHHPEMRSMADVRKFIEIGYFRTMAQGVIDRAVNGNGTAEHSMALRIARFLNTPRSIELVDWAYDNPAEGMRYVLSNEFFIDGAGYESPGYNVAHSGGVARFGGLLDRVAALRPEQYAGARFPLLSESSRFRSMFDHNIDLSLISRTRPYVGDDGDLADTDPLPIHVGIGLPRETWAKALARWPDDERYAKACWDAGRGAPAAELTDPALRARVTEVVGRDGPSLELPSRILPGFGHVVLSAGRKDDQRDLWMRYGTMYGHAHHDGLTIGYEALQRTLLPEQGYNRGDNLRTEWDMNWALHYCARITGASREPADGWGSQGNLGGNLELFADGGWARAATAARRFVRPAPAPRLMTPCDDLVQQRTIALVDVDERRSYAVSIFRVGGGTDHYLSFHGPRGVARAEGLDLKPQAGGTLAGPDVPYGQKWDSAWSKQNPHLMMFPYLYDVRRASAAEPWRVTWDLEKHPDVHLRLHGLSPAHAQVALAKGKPPGGGKPYELEWVVQHATGGEPLNSAFVEVIEAYDGEPIVGAVRRVAVEPERAVALQVVCGDRVDTIIHNPDPTGTVKTANGITMTGAFGIWSEQRGRVSRVLLADGGRIAAAGREVVPAVPTWTGTIRSADFEKGSVVVTPAPPHAELLVGRYVRITNDGGNDGMHLVKAALPTDGGVELRLALDPRIGECPVRRVYADGLDTAIQLRFGGLYYRGKTLANEDASSLYKLNGIASGRAFIASPDRPVGEAALTAQFADHDGNGVACFLVYDYGPGDRVTVPSVESWTAK